MRYKVKIHKANSDNYYGFVYGLQGVTGSFGKTEENVMRKLSNRLTEYIHHSIDAGFEVFDGVDGNENESIEIDQKSALFIKQHNEKTKKKIQST